MRALTDDCMAMTDNIGKQVEYADEAFKRALKIMKEIKAPHYEKRIYMEGWLTQINSYIGYEKID